MSAVAEVLAAEAADLGSPWGTFERVREHLYEQASRMTPSPETGLSADEVAAEVERWLEAHPDSPRVLLRAHAFRIVTSRARIAVDPADWFVSRLDHGGVLRRLRDRWLREARTGPIAAEAAWCEQAHSHGVALAGLDLGHISAGWDTLFALGFGGLVAQARAAAAAAGARASPAQRAFWQAVEIVCDAAGALAARFADYAESLAATSAADAARLAAVATACRALSASAPATFHQALQIAWLMHELIEMEGVAVRSMGHFDRSLYAIYRRDVDAGRLTPQQARELIKFYWIKWYARTRGHDNGKNFVFGGQDSTGEPIANELTWLALEAYEELSATDPKLSIRILPSTPDRLVRRVADMIRGGHAGFVLMNDVVAVDALVRSGKKLEDARRYVPIGCYEPAVDGKEAACTTNIIVNLAKAVELALHDGCDALTGTRLGPSTGDPRAFASFEDLRAAYEAQLDAMVTGAITATAAHERQWPRVNPSPLIAATIEGCLARGRDVGEGGPLYNSVGCIGFALANACDSLSALRRTVYEEQRWTMAELIDALDADFRGREPMRQYLLHRVPRWGNGDPEVDGIAKRIADVYCHKVHSFTNGRGGRCQAALYGLLTWREFGEGTAALPDGRKARAPLAAGVGCSAGADRCGVTGLIDSVTRLDFSATPNGSVLDVMLHPTAVAGHEGLDAFVALIRTFFAKGGYAVQFNVVSLETLRDAQLHPERYGSLQIRVTGWSAYWNRLSREEQELFLERNVHGGA
jgi:pyruvate-formate lyase